MGKSNKETVSRRANERRGFFSSEWCQLTSPVSNVSLSLTVTIYYRTPSSGGMAGGTVLTVEGRGFAEDLYTSSNVVWLQGHDGTNVLCDFIRLGFGWI